MSGTFSEYKENQLKTIALNGQFKASEPSGYASHMAWTGTSRGIETPQAGSSGKEWNRKDRRRSSTLRAVAAM